MSLVGFDWAAVAFLKSSKLVAPGSVFRMNSLEVLAASGQTTSASSIETYNRCSSNNFESFLKLMKPKSPVTGY